MTNPPLTILPPSGTRDFWGRELAARRAAQGKILAILERAGFQGMETPAFERIETILGKYGAEAEKLIFRILKRGVKDDGQSADMALRYDLTVPLSRFMVTHGAEVKLPFKRSQIGMVWRADRPGKGRFREFTQCDFDIVGTADPAADLEILLTVNRCLSGLGLSGYVLRINTRSALHALLGSYGVREDDRGAVVTALDKLDKQSAQDISGELAQIAPQTLRLHELQRDILCPMVDWPGIFLRRLDDFAPNAATEVRTLVERFQRLAGRDRGRYDPLLARGLDYYTGMIFEAVHPDIKGSIAGGGRYDELVRTARGVALPSCGGSIGFERILPLLALDDAARGTGRILVLRPQADADLPAALLAVESLRDEGLDAAMFLGGAKDRRKQVDLALKEGLQFIAYGTPDPQQFMLRDLRDRTEWTFPLREFGAGVSDVLRRGESSKLPG